MSLITSTKSDNEEYPTCPLGTFPVRCIQVIDTGTQMNDYQGDVTWKKQIILVFEVFAEDADGDDYTYLISGTYNVTFGKKANLRKLLDGWVPGEIKNDTFDFSTLLGKTGLGTTAHKDRGPDRGTWVSLSNVIGVVKGITVPDQKNEFLAFDIDEPSVEVYDKLPEWIRDRIDASSERSGNGPESTIKPLHTPEPVELPVFMSKKDHTAENNPLADLWTGFIAVWREVQPDLTEGRSDDELREIAVKRFVAKAMPVNENTLKKSIETMKKEISQEPDDDPMSDRRAEPSAVRAARNKQAKRDAAKATQEPELSDLNEYGRGKFKFIGELVNAKTGASADDTKGFDRAYDWLVDNGDFLKLNDEILAPVVVIKAKQEAW